jgi:integrase
MAAIRERPPGSNKWYVIVSLGRNEYGKPVQKWIRLRSARNKTEAKREAVRIEHELNAGSWVPPSKLTVGDLLVEWLTSAKPRLSPKTYQEYERIIIRHLIPALGRVPLDRVSPLTLEHYFARKRVDGRLDGPGGLSELTLRHHFAILHRAFRQAVRWRYLTFNPTDGIDPPVGTAAEQSTYSDAETVQLLRAVEVDAELHVPVVLAATLGMRRGEILGLKWSDVDLTNQTLTIRRALQETKELGLFEKSPKTPGSRRRVALPQLVVDVLREHQVRQRQALAELTGAVPLDGYVCARADGRPWRPNNFSERYARFLSESGLRAIPFKNLRHTHATSLLRSGVPAKIVSERLGHSRIGTTMDIYSHVTPDMQADAAARVDELLRIASGDELAGS